jgi:putative aldouronate transport system substrate-binding protein
VLPVKFFSGGERMKKRMFILQLLLLVMTASLVYAGGARSGSDSGSGRKKIRVEIFERNATGLNAADNWQTKWVQENWGDPRNVDIEFVPIPRAQEIDMLNILMSANNAPDLCYTYNTATVYNYVQNGGLWELGTHLESETGRKLSAYLGESVLAWGRWNGKQYSIPSRRIDVGATATFIRKDWLDKLGLPVPSSFDEFYNTIVAFKEKDPGGLGNAVIPLAMEAYDPNISWSAATILDAFLEPMMAQQLAVTRNVEFARPGIKEGLKYLNKLYHEGLISPNFALDKDQAQYYKDILSGKVGAFIRSPVSWIYGGSNSQELDKSAPGALFIPCDPFPNKQGVKAKRSNDPIGYYVFLPKTAKYPELVIDYMAWQTDPEIQINLKFGKQGINYEGRDADGIPYGIKPNADVLNEYKFPGGTDICVVINGNDYGSQELNDKAKILANPRYGTWHVEADRVANNGRFEEPPITTPIASEAALGSTLRAKGNELYVRSIMAPPAQFDQTFESFLKEYMDIGGKRIIDEKLAAWAKEHP